MASIYDLKPKFQAFLRPLTGRLYKAGVTPNHVTIMAMLGSLLVGLLSVKSLENRLWLLIFPIWLFLRMALNAIDGLMAREFDLKSHAGAVLNETGDVLSDIFLFLPFALIRPDAGWAVIFFTIGAMLSEFCGILGQALGGRRRYEGPMGKSDRAFLIGALALVSIYFPWMMDWWAYFFWGAFVLVLWTSRNRTAVMLKELNND
ncbi:MAG: CDP-alcohol phosphatidyltransferase family protein [Candidatus Omnitrophica bacterium]|nr:CDP-alcohol phosphatidyltransferase family protein [Candidatus Omnitrophota bacterium]